MEKVLDWENVLIVLCRSDSNPHVCYADANINGWGLL